MPKLAYFTDSHVMGKNPGARIDNYPQAIYNKFKDMIQHCIDNDIKTLVHGGDFFDQPRVALSIINKYSRLLRKAKKTGIDVYLVPGNHDLFGYLLDTLPQTAIGNLAASGLVKLLTREKNYMLEIDGVKVALHGREYSEDIDHNPKKDYQIDPIKGATWQFLFSHGMLLEKPFHPDVRHTLTSDVKTKADVVFNGHYHPGYPLHENADDVWFVNPGSVARDEASADNFKRIPQFAICEFDKKNLTVTFHKFPSAAKGKDIFDTTATQNKKHHQRYLEQFSQTIEDAIQFESYDPKDVLQQIMQSGTIPTHIYKQAFEAVVDAESSVTVSKLDGYVEKASPIAIKKVEIENFQSHKHTIIELNEQGLNALTGASDSGKSAIVRAIRWCLYNDPKGSDFIRHGESRATVTVTFSDDTSITRSRTASSAGEYIVRDASGNEKTFKGFSNDVPIEVANTHQMPRVELAPGIDRAINFSYQLDGHFLLSESPSVRAATIGRLTGVHVVDAARKEQDKEHRKIVIDMNKAEERVEELTEKAKAYDDLPEIEQNLNLVRAMFLNADQLEKDIEILTADYHDIYDLAKAVKQIQKDLETYDEMDLATVKIDKAELMMKEIAELTTLYETLVKEAKAEKRLKHDLEAYEDLDAALAAVEKADTLMAEITDLKAIETELQTADNAERHLESLIVGLPQIDLNQVARAEALADELAELRLLQDNLEKKDRAVTSWEKALENADQEIADAEKALADFMQKEMGNRCPCCMQDLDEASAHHVLEYVG